MERYRTRLRIGAALMAVGFIAEVVMLVGMAVDRRPPVWVWGLLLLIGVGAAVVASAFIAAARERSRRTRAAAGEAPPRR